MGFNFLIGEESRREGINYNYREAVRAIVIKGSSILMMHNCKGDYKLPGGGVEPGESYESALFREVEEETGYAVINIIEELGTTVERRLDVYEQNKGFEMISTYYSCNISDEYVGRNLTEHEKILELEAEWVDIEYALLKNTMILQSQQEINPWVIREVRVLQKLYEQTLNL
jgi:8-oxo-dGTP pyrophosphatase MutT (NUDIX family)